ncbi:MAG: PAS domain S-box protein [Armatimonadia bacterium]|nr:PAS domain S-box protein [Armatimonadia bacterium]
MIVAILANLSQDWLHDVQESALRGATVLRADGPEATRELMQTVPADLVLTELPRLTEDRLRDLRDLRGLADDAVLLCIAPSEVIERVRLERLAEPDLWLTADADEDQRGEVLARAVETARLQGEMDAMQADLDNGCHVSASAEGRPVDLEAFNRLMGGLSSGFDLDRLLEAFTDAVSHFTQCAGYALLWEAEDGCLRVRCHRGVRSEVVEDARLCPDDALPTWYRRNRRVLTCAELGGWSDRRLAVKVSRELELFGGQIALPLMVRGRLAGVLMLGDKVLGEGYSRGELEMLFGVTNHVALAAQGVELHTELGRSKAYTDNIVESMGAGLVTLGKDERITLCNPHAAEILGVSRKEVEGADLRALPSPLGDMLYAGLKSPGGQSVSEEVTIRGGQKTLRVSTSAVRGEQGEVLGSVLMLDDITALKELARERSRRERLDVLTKIVGRIAHEVKNPLTAVKTYAELMSGRRGDDRLTKFWSETVLPEIDRLDEMLKNLLRMVEQPDPHVESARVEDLIEQALEVLPMAEEVKRQAFDLQFADDLPPVLVDPPPTRDAISYLLSYLAGSRPDPVQVEVEGRNEGNPGVTVKMTRRTRSNGIFDPDTVFDPLAAMQNPESDLGPVISQKIITNQHGQVEAWRDEGRVTMRVVLPNSEAHAESGREVH